MNLLNKLTIKNLKLNKKRTIVTIIGIILSVALVSAVATMYSSAINSLINYTIKERGDYHYVYDDVSPNGVDTIKNNQGVEKVYLTSNIGYAKLDDSKNEYKPYAYLKAYDKEALNNLAINLVEGRLPENDSEIIIPTHLKTNGRIDLKVGDYITLEVGKRVSDGYILNQSNPYDTENNEHIIDTVSKTYHIVGIAERPASSIEPYDAPGYTFITYLKDFKTTDKVDVYTKYNKIGLKNNFEVTANILGVKSDILAKYLDGDGNYSQSEYDNILAEMKNSKYEFDFNSYLITLQTNPLKEGTAKSLGTVVLIVCLIIVFTSVFCIKNSFDISITEKTKQYGMLRSVGATKKQIRKNVFYEATILGLIGIPLGIFFGLFASFILIIISNIFLNGMLNENIHLVFTYSTWAIIFAIILGIITIYFSAFKSAKRASKISPIDSIRNSADIKITVKKLKTPKLIRKIFGIGGEISYKNQKRNKKKYRTTTISIAVSVCTFIALASFMGLAFQTIKNELNISEYNIYLYAKDYKNTTYEKILETTKLDNIKDVSVMERSDFTLSGTYYGKEYINWLGYDITDTDAHMTIVALNTTSYQKYLKSLNLDYETLKDKGVLVDKYPMTKYSRETSQEEKKILREFDFQVGDIIKGTLLEKDASITVGALSDKYPYGLQGYDSSVLVVDEEFYKTLPHKSIYVEAKYDSSNATKLQEEIEEILKGEDYELYNSEERVNQMRNLYTLVGIFLYGFIIVISLIGITNIFNTITTNMQLRRSEFAMLKSIGMTSKEFKAMIRLEILFMGAKSLLSGIIVGTGLSYLIYYYMSSSESLGFKLPLIPIVISIFAVYLLITIIMKYSLGKINKQNIIETIRNENI